MAYVSGVRKSAPSGAAPRHRELRRHMLADSARGRTFPSPAAADCPDRVGISRHAASRRQFKMGTLAAVAAVRVLIHPRRHVAQRTF